MRAPSSQAPLFLAASLLVVGLSPLGCKPKPSDEQVPGAAPSAAPSTAPDAQSAEALRKKTELLPPAEVQQATNNPEGLPVYDGPTGTVRGVVRAVGDSAPSTSDAVSKAKADCRMAHPMFGKLFREGDERRLADVLVAATGYKAFLPAKRDTVTLNGEGCAWERRTVALMFGQKLNIVAMDRRPYVPEFVGQPSVAQLFAMPNADPVAMVPRKPGRFLLIDSMRLYNRADVFTLTYPTAVVTELDGKFEIQGIPVGKVKVSAFLPATNAVVEAEVEVVAGQPVELSFELPFDAAKQPMPANQP